VKKHAVVLAIVTLVVILTEWIAGYALVARDPIHGFLSLSIGTIVAAISVMAARVVLYLVIPGWALALGVLVLVARLRSEKPR
jgi:hypothetical protein